MTVKFGVFVPQGWRMDLVKIKDPIEKYEAMTRVAQTADRGPWDSIWVYDHFHTMPTPQLEATFECWTITSTLVRDTKRVRVGQMVGCNGYRNPALYAKIASTVDVASHGRLNAGIGAGWYEHEWRAYGYGFPELKERMGMFKEACEIIHRMWTEDYPVFKGTYYAIDRPINEPKGVQKPHPPLWIGGGGERVTLKLVAQYGDACNVGGGDPAVVRHKLDVLRRHCDALGRDYDTIVKSTNVPVYLGDAAEIERLVAVRARQTGQRIEAGREGYAGTPAEVAERILEVTQAGIDYVVLQVPNAAEGGAIQRVAEELLPLMA